jgi:protein-tyrosine kinase
MDRIRKALDLARQDRARLVEKETTETTELQARASEPAVAAQALGTIAYAKTRVFSPPPAVLESHRILDPSGSAPAAAAFRMLRTQVLQRMDEKGWRSIGMLSPNADEGKTTTAVNLALSLANDRHHTVLLVDCDLKRPSIASTLGITPEFGLNDVLTGSARIEQCLYHAAEFDRLVVLPGRATIMNSSEALSGPRGRELVSELRARYPDRLVLFDLPPVLGADDALAFLPSIECGLVVVAEGLTPREDLLRCMELLRNIPLVGTVLNRSTAVTSAYG